MARTEHRAPAPQSAGTAPAPALAARGRGLAGGPGTRQVPPAKGTGPVMPLGTGPRKPGRQGGLGRPRPRPTRQGPRAAHHPPTVPDPGSPVIVASPPPSASREKKGLVPAAWAHLAGLQAGPPKGWFEAAFRQ